MERLVTVALVGTARQSAAPEGAAPTDGLVARLGDLDAERSLLLRAGALAAYRLAGRAPGGAMAPLEAAPDETAPSCASVATELIGRMLEGIHPEFLPEALDRLGRAGLILPPEVLVAALSVRPSVIHGAWAALAAALGERGRWLAALNPAWEWVRDALEENEAVPVDADTIWEEKHPTGRLRLLRQVRQIDPARARGWLAATWPHEKPSMRAHLIGALQTGLSSEDETLLTQALADKSVEVRQQAARLLARLPQSAYATRMRERADAMLTSAAGALKAKPPAMFDPAWARDGIVETAPHGTGKRAWWLTQMLGSVPPAHWSERFGLSPAALIAAAGTTDYERALIEGWSRGAQLHQDAAWAPALWGWCLAPHRGVKVAEDDMEEWRDALGALVPRAVAEERIGRLLDDSTDPAYVNADELVAALPAPWSAAFGARYLDAARAAAGAVGGKQGDAYDWCVGMQAAVTALPPDCFAAALAPWTVHEPEKPSGKRWQDQIEEFTEPLDFRRRLIEAIPVGEERDGATTGGVGGRGTPSN